jgi:hypothetical protein
MEAGPELDALVAEKVMGWTPQPDGRHDPDNSGVVFRPSTSDAAAVEVLRKKGADDAWSATIEMDPRQKSIVWRANVDLEHATAPTFALAICRAALKAAAS